MINLNDLAVFERVAAFRSFSDAARALGLSKSSVSRAVDRLEASLGDRLLQRSTRSVQLTLAGAALQERCATGLEQLGEAVDIAIGLGGTPRGPLRISAGIGFGINVLGRQLPAFLDRYPDIDVALDLTSREADLVTERVDVAIRMGTLPDSSLVSSRLGSMTRHLCVAPSYLARRGRPGSLAELDGHDLIEMPSRDGRARAWRFTCGAEAVTVGVSPRVAVNEALTIARLVTAGAGIGIISGYLAAPALADGTMIALFPDWRLPSIDVNLVFPSRREISSAVRAFVDFMRETNAGDAFWMERSHADPC